MLLSACYFFFFSSRRRHTRFDCDWSSDVCSSDLHNRFPRLRAPLRRQSLRVAAAALAIAGIGYGGIVMFHSFTHETTDDAFVDVHTVFVAPKVAGHVAVVRVEGNQLVKKVAVLVEIDPSAFPVKLAQGRAER